VVGVTELIIVMALLQYLFFGMLVSRARTRYGVKAPAITGDPIFERHLRVQMNTLELLVIFLPALWIASAYIGPLWIAALGAVYLAGRLFYLWGYVRAAEKRALGFGLSALPILILLAIDLIGSLRSLFGG
jgi:glutathione S-transferase